MIIGKYLDSREMIHLFGFIDPFRQKYTRIAGDDSEVSLAPQRRAKVRRHRVA